MIQILVFILPIVLVISSPLFTASRKKISIITHTGQVILHFSESKIPEKTLRKYVVIYPHSAASFIYQSGTILEECVANDPQYFPCGSRDIKDPNFFKNVEVNLKLSKNAMKYLDGLNDIAVLKPAVEFYKKELSFYIWLNETRLNFYKSWDTNVLKQKYGDIDPMKEAQDVIKRIEQAKSKEEKYNLAKYDWHNKLNNVFRKNDEILYKCCREDYFGKEYKDTPFANYSPEPLKPWKDFLKQYDIKEEIIDEVQD